MTPTRFLTFAALSAAALFACKSGNAVDLSQGGTELVFQLPQGFDAARSESALAEAAKVAAARLSSARLPAVVAAEGGRLRVKLPRSVAAEQVAEARQTVAAVGKLEYRKVDDGAALKELLAKLPADSGLEINRDTWNDLSGAARGAFIVDAESEEQVEKALSTLPAGTAMPSGIDLVAEKGDGQGARFYALEAPAFDNAAIAAVGVGKDPQVPPEVAITLNADGAAKYAELSRKAVGRKIAAVVDGKIVETVAMMQAASGSTVTISFVDRGTRQERQRAAELLAAILVGGPMPAALQLEETRELPPSR